MNPMPRYLTEVQRLAREWQSLETLSAHLPDSVRPKTPTTDCKTCDWLTEVQFGLLSKLSHRPSKCMEDVVKKLEVWRAHTLGPEGTGGELSDELVCSVLQDLEWLIRGRKLSDQPH